MVSQSTDNFKILKTFWEELLQLGITKHEVFSKAQLPITIFDETVSANTVQFFAIWRAFSELVNEPSTSVIKLIKNKKTSQLSPIVLSSYHAPNYREALNRLSRYKQLCTPERILISEEGENCTIEFEWLYSDLPEPSMLSSYLMAFLVEIGRRGTGKHLVARHVEFLDPINDLKGLEDYFGCPIQIGAKRNRLTLLRSDLDTTFISYNAELLDILTPALDRSLDEQKSKNSISEIVKEIIKQHLTGGRPKIQDISKELCISERTLQRKLSDSGTNFNKLLNEARHEKAKEYLKNETLEIKEVAFMLGYDDQNSFFRAFKLWERTTPSNWRANN